MTASRRVEVVAGVVVVLAHEVEVQRVFPSLRRHLEERLVVATAFVSVAAALVSSARNVDQEHAVNRAINRMIRFIIRTMWVGGLVR